MDQKQQIMNLVYGGIVGDALGLPYEGLSQKARARIFKDPGKFHFLFGRGIVSDDTDHLLLTLHALRSTQNEEDFAKMLTKSLTRWLITLPPGIGGGTLVSLVKRMFFGSRGEHGSNSAGNGPCMRAPAIGALFHSDLEKLTRYTITSTKITHKNPKTITTALAIARLTALNFRGQEKPQITDIFDALRQANVDNDVDWFQIVDHLSKAYTAGENLAAFTKRLGIDGYVSGYCYHSVPVAIFIYLKYGDDFEKTILEAVSCGGDTDTIAFIAGCLAGAARRLESVPQTFIDGVLSWPCDQGFLHKLVTSNEHEKINYPWLTLLLRNLISWSTIIIHILRRVPVRLFPPRR